MSTFSRVFLSLFLFLYAATSFALTANEQSVRDAGQQWATALGEHNPKKVTALYDKNAYVYPTFENMADSQADILAYFKKIVQNKGLHVTFLKQHVRVYGETAVNSGEYVFAFEREGKPVEVPARYTFVYILTPQGWKIVDHHSSILPM
jgi:hypothetical protein